MSVGLLLRAEIKPTLRRFFRGKPSAESVLGEVQAWVEKYSADLLPDIFLGESDGRPTLYCKLHPGAEEVEFRLAHDGFLEVSANTSSAGPGFHIFVCDMLRNMARPLNLAWQPPTEDYGDETEYFHTGNVDSVYQHMTSWVSGLAGTFFDGTIDKGFENVRLAMSMDAGFTWEARAQTPLGPRDEEWLRKTAQDGRHGRDFFAWWTPGLNAEYFLGRALVRMWADVRWRKPVNDEEKSVLEYVVSSLETAYKLAPDLEYPWAEWAEIQDLLEITDDVSRSVRQRAAGRQPIIGYRRREVDVRLPGNWWIRILGSFSDFRSEGDAYCAQDPPLGIWFTPYAFVEESEAPFAHWREQVDQMDKDFLEERLGYVAMAKIKHSSEDGEDYFAMTTLNVCLAGRCVCTIVYEDPRDEEWAKAVWKSLKPPNRSNEPRE
jgi:hypothetical protein